MEDIRRDFFQRYLSTHERYLDAIWAVGVPPGDGKVVRRIGIPTEVIDELKGKARGIQGKSIRAMRNAWYHECAFWCPENNENEWIRFAPWKIIQFYYSIFCMISAMVRCIDDSPQMAHKTVIDKFTKSFIMNVQLNQVLFYAPFCFYLDNGTIHPSPVGRVPRTYALENDFPILPRCLASIPNRSAKPISVFHYFKSLREWATYEDSYIFMNLYGPTVKGKLRHYLQHILPAFLCIGENFLVAFWGADIIRTEFDSFTSGMIRVTEFTPSSLQSRFEEYRFF